MGVQQPGRVLIEEHLAVTGSAAIGTDNLTPLAGAALADDQQGDTGDGQRLMALSRYVVTSTVTVTPDALAVVTAGEPGTGGTSGFGSSATVSPPTSGKFGLWAGTYQTGTVIVAYSAVSTPLTGPQALYQAIGAGNLRAYVQGQDDVGHAALSN